MIVELLGCGILSSAAAAGVAAGLRAIIGRSRVLARLLRRPLGLNIHAKEFHLDVFGATLTLRGVTVHDRVPENMDEELHTGRKTSVKQQGMALFAEEVVVCASGGTPQMLDVTLSNPTARIRFLEQDSGDDVSFHRNSPVPSNWACLAQRVEQYLHDLQSRDNAKLRNVFVRSVRVLGEGVVATTVDLETRSSTLLVDTPIVVNEHGYLPLNPAETPSMWANFIADHVHEHLYEMVVAEKARRVARAEEEAKLLSLETGPRFRLRFFGQKPEKAYSNPRPPHREYQEVLSSKTVRSVPVRHLIAEYEERADAVLGSPHREFRWTNREECSGEEI